jgi:hypothetical protein
MIERLKIFSLDIAERFERNAFQEKFVWKDRLKFDPFFSKGSEKTAEITFILPYVISNDFWKPPHFDVKFQSQMWVSVQICRRLSDDFVHALMLESQQISEVSCSEKVVIVASEIFEKSIVYAATKHFGI